MSSPGADAAVAAVCSLASLAGPLAVLVALSPAEAARALWRLRAAVLRRAPPCSALPLARVLRQLAEALDA